ncbi:PQQ-binding-like beta-propeller repeat protein [Streptomyces sp. 5-8]|uniref:PQQ-binding-like beta-propeller repeat protein n=1 Tax=Streptomyces musisoli TaxID=2802280 RepID=A0ABS1NZF5_9ACTN|nr:PQQ-binding-like beta-propeller repeat protein [Streptomyces musisoli]MBL1105496.1 PQQ-binding-like beta-propeller repeat protein [Streptomyces musisoli]
METLEPDDPRELGSYRMLRRLGAGGMGRVYLARSPGGRTVAVKVVRPDLAADAGFRERFRHEAEIAQAVSGQYTAAVVDADPGAPLPWLATSYVLGPDLTEVVAAHGPLPEHTVRALGAGLAAALQEIHAAGLIHRDLKPSNVLLAADGPRVIDFGIARAVDGTRMTQTGVVVGSPGYMPPEQAMGKDVGPAGDVFSLGAVLAFAVTGRSAFGDGAASHAAMLYQVVHGEADLTGIPRSLLGLVRACLLKDPAGRPAPAEIVAALAPQGVEGLLRDWLPSAVASTIATHAAGILDLEAPEAQPPAAGGTGAGAGAGAGAGVGSAAGGAGFGPAPTMLDGAGTPAAGGAPVGGTPAGGTPVGGTPVAGSPAAGYGYPPAQPAGYGTPPGGTPQSTPGYGTSPGGTAQSTPGYGRSPGGTAQSTPGHGTPAGGTAVPGTVQLGASGSSGSSAARPTRRRALSLALGGAAAVAAVGGGTAWWLGRDTGADGTPAGGKGGASAEPAAENFTTPPAGVAPQPLWHRELADDGTSAVPLLVHDGLLLISGDPLVAYDVKTGKSRWSKPDLVVPGSQLLYRDGRMYLPDGEYDGVLIARDAATGEEVWRSRLGKRIDIEDTIAIDDQHVYVAASDFSESKSATDYRTAVAAVSLATRKTVWIQKRDWGTDDYDVEGSVSGKYLVYADSKFNLTVRDTATGAQLWTKKIGDDWFWRPTASDGLVFLPGDELTAVDLKTGATRWTLSPSGRRGFYTPTVIDGVLYVGDHDRGIWAVDVHTGKRIWLCEDNDRGAPEVFLKSGTTLYCGAQAIGGGVVALDAKTGRKRWSWTDNKGTGDQWQIALSGSRLLMANGSDVYAMPAV